MKNNWFYEYLVNLVLVFNKSSQNNPAILEKKFKLCISTLKVLNKRWINISIVSNADAWYPGSFRINLRIVFKKELRAEVHSHVDRFVVLSLLVDNGAEFSFSQGDGRRQAADNVNRLLR